VHPPRLSHLLTRAELVARLTATYAKAHEVDEEVAAEVLDRALRGPLREQLLDAIWNALQVGTSRLGDDRLLDKVARAMTDAPRRSKAAVITPALGAALIRIDLEAGEAGESARRLLERKEGKAAADAGLAELGAFLAREATKK
jgi:hypothetical protein